MNYYERHIGDYLKDTAHLSLLEHGVYTRLLDVYYTREGGIPAADAPRLIGARSKDERAALQAVLGEFFQLVDGLHVQDRSEREIERYQGKQAKAKASADARWGAQRAHSERNANASSNDHAHGMRTHSERNALDDATRGGAGARPQTPVTRPIPREENPPAARVPPADAVADSAALTAKDLVAEGVEPAVAADWLRVRKAKKAPLTRTAWEGLKREAALAGMTAPQAVKHAAESGWQGFKAAWIRDGAPTSITRTPTAADRRNAVMDELTGRNRNGHRTGDGAGAAKADIVDIAARVVG